MNKIEVIELLIKNGYAKHPVFNFFHKPKQTLGHFFYVNDDCITTGKIKWGNISLTETKEVRVKQFQAHSFGLVTDLDRKMQAENAKRMAVNRAKHNSMKAKGYVDTESYTDDNPLPTPLDQG